MSASGQTRISRRSNGRRKIIRACIWNWQSCGAFRPQSLRHIPRGLESSTANSLKNSTAIWRVVIAVIGDGSLQYSVQSLASAARHKLKVIYFIPAP
jgi:hypothetical protein